MNNKSSKILTMLVADSLNLNNLPTVKLFTLRWIIILAGRLPKNLWLVGGAAVGQWRIGGVGQNTMRASVELTFW